MTDTLTLFKNHKQKVFCVSTDSTAFSVLDCSAITLPQSMMNHEIEDWRDQGFKHVGVQEFAEYLKQDREWPPSR